MITLSSDFGPPYPAAMKGVVLSRTDARLVDVSHEFPRQDVRAAAFWLREVLPWFPPAVHLVVVDPGVGTDRSALAVRADGHADGGDEDDGTVEVFEVHYDAPESNTFHGRDVFAPAAARVHEAGVGSLESLDGVAPIDEYEDLAFPEPTVEADGTRGEVLVVDGFGNVVTNVPGGVLEGRYGGPVVVNDAAATAVRAYAEADPGTRVVTVGSHGNVELAVDRGRGDRAFGVEPGDPVRLSW
ncbi:S-adenosyl-l-methionine hydroxide adenosyltransferase [Halobacteriales archaeon QS_5_70_15]|nr:MAG: S-adenosyl-l-methionine hydroxide adenosyltransferase [Halobacteriales archaeon QS_5_70_15]